MQLQRQASTDSPFSLRTKQDWHWPIPQKIEFGRPSLETAKLETPWCKRAVATVSFSVNPTGSSFQKNRDTKQPHSFLEID